MKHYQNFLFIMVTSISMLGCGADSSNSKTDEQAQPGTPHIFSTKFSGHLSIRGDKITSKTITAAHSLDHSAHNAYEVQHIFDAGTRYIRLQYQVAYPKPNSILAVEITPEHQIRRVAIVTEPSTPENNLSVYNCISNTVEIKDNPHASFACSNNIKLNYNKTTGESEIEFTDLQLRTNSLSNSNGARDLMYPIDATSQNAKLYLSGTIKGQLAKAPQTFSTIPRTSTSSLTLDGLPLELNYAYGSSSGLTFSRKEQNTDTLKNQQRFFASFNHDQLVAFKVDFSLSFGTACHKFKSFNVEDLSTVTTTGYANKWHLRFNNFQYGGVSENWPRLDLCPDFGTHILNGEVSVRIPNTSFTIEPFFSLYSINEPIKDSIELINDDTIILKSNDIDIMVKNNQVQHVTTLLRPHSTSIEIIWAILGFSPIYQCNATDMPCTNVEYDPQNMHITFNNMSVINNLKQDFLPKEMKIKGHLDFMGY